MRDAIEIGDKVTYKHVASGPLMIVTDLNTHSAQCEWYDDEFKQVWFPQDDLREHYDLGDEIAKRIPDKYKTQAARVLTVFVWVALVAIAALVTWAVN